MKSHARYPGDQPIGDAADQVAPDGRVLARLTPSRNDIVTLAELGEHQRDVARIVLQIGVDRDDHIAPRVIDAGHQGGGLAGIAAKLNDLELRVMFGRGLEHLLRGVAAAVIDGDDLVAVVKPVELGDQPFEERRDALFLVVDRHHHGQLWPVEGGRGGRLLPHQEGHASDPVHRFEPLVCAGIARKPTGLITSIAGAKSDRAASRKNATLMLKNW